MGTTRLGQLNIKCLPENDKRVKFGSCTDCQFIGALDSATTAIEIDQNTEIYIWFDDSGSMNSTLSPLQSMRNTILKNCLVQFFNNDGDLYDTNVTVNNFSSKSSGMERTLFMLNTMGSSGSITKVINLVFQDEASPYNADSRSFNTNSRTSQYDSDLASFRTALGNAATSDYYRGIVFRVNTGSGRYDGFRQFLEAVDQGTGAYSGTNGLSDKSEVTFVQNVTAGASAQYYADQIIAALNTLGYNLDAC